jgi:adenylylsulfate kinase-like enzyme
VDVSITILSGPIGAGKTTVAKELLSLLPAPAAYIEGDTFWSFIAKPHSDDRREVFHVIMRAMAAASIPLARSGYHVLLDFSIPPQFLVTARKIIKEVPLNFVALVPSLSVCEARAGGRAKGRIKDYAAYRDFYALFDPASPFVIADDEGDAQSMATKIYDGLTAGKFVVE